MSLSKVSFLFLLFLILEVKSQVLSSQTHCFGNCMTCDPLNLAQCTGQQPCQWGFYDPQKNGTCIVSPSAQIVSKQLGERSKKSERLTASGWSGAAKQSLCQYPSSAGIKFIDVLGFYSGVQMIEKTFKVDPQSQIFEISFNILHDEWLPFNDFLIVDISSNSLNIQTLEISYDTKVNMNSHEALIICQGKRVVSQKYSIKVINSKKNYNDLTLIFTSFLYNSIWGISNLKVIQGCNQYSLFDSKTELCGKCDPDSYSVQFGQTMWCEKCPLLCATCENKNKCLTCVQGATTDNTGMCSFGKNFKTQLMPINTTKNYCDNFPLMIGSETTPVSLGSLKNDNHLLYDEIQVGFLLYYNPIVWKTLSLIVKLNKVQVMRLSIKNLTNKAESKCDIFSREMARMQIFSDKIVHTDNVVNLEWNVIGGKGQFGIAEVRVKSIKKNSPNNKKTNQVPQNKPTAANKTQPSNTSTTDTPSPVNKTSPTNSPPQKNTTSPKTQQPTINSTKTSPQTQQSPSNNNTSNSSNNTQLPPQNQNSNSGNKISQTTPTLPPKVPQNPPQIAFMPTLSNKKSGLEVFISNIQFSGYSYYSASIDKLSPDEYTVDSYYLQDSRLHLFITVKKSFIQGKVSIYGYTTQRLLQASVASPTLLGNFSVQRFDSLNQSQIQGIDVVSTFFTISAWIGVILIIIAVMLGNSVVVEQYVLILQIIFLHVYIASDYIPLTFRDTIGGLNLIENLNYFISSHSEAIEHQWMGNVVQNGPVRFTLFRTDINFLREFYPIIIINIIYSIWFILLFIARKIMNKDMIEEEKGLVNKYLDSIAGRFINTTDQIWRYQFLATIWACFVQFYNLVYPSGSDRNQGINTAICIFAFLITLAWPVFIIFYTRKQYYECEYSQFLYYYEDIYYMKIPQYELPSNHHRMGYPAIRAGKIFLIALTICYLGNIASLILVILTLLNIIELIYIKIQDIFNDKRYFLHKAFENISLIIIDLILLGLLNSSSLARSQSYIYIGFVLAGLALLTIGNAFIRMFYICYKKYRQAIEDDSDWIFEEKKPKTTRVV